MSIKRAGRPLLARIGLPDATSRLAAATILSGVVAGLVSVDTTSLLLGEAKRFVVGQFDRVFVGVANLAILAIVGLWLHPVAARRLGTSDARPEFSRLSWLAMLFSAGLASGLLYWATAEPILHAQSNPILELAGPSADAQRIAMRLTMLHWGIHGWAFYVVAALAVAIQAYRHDRPVSFRSAFLPLLGPVQIDRWPGRLIDLLAAFGTVCGVATSIGLSSASMNATLSSLIGIEVSVANQVAIVFAISLAGIASALSGIKYGIRWLSEMNVVVSVFLMFAFLVLGPGGEVLVLLGETAVDYLRTAIPTGLYLGETAAARAWQGDWTVFYWAWWLAWTPFVSVFIARISRGRTIREFALVVSIVPTLVTLLWMGIFGGTALVQEAAAPGSVSLAVNADYAKGLVAVIEGLGQGTTVTLLMSIAALLLLSWLVTSLDSATLVMCHLLGVDEAPGAKIFWGAVLGSVASVLLVAGGLDALQAASIVMGLPLALLIAALIAGLARDVLTDRI